MQQEKYGFIYIWFDKKNTRFYIGSHWGYENDGYICSSRMMRQAYNRRPEDFKRRIISRIYSNREDLLLEEERWLKMIDPDKTTPRNTTVESRQSVRYYNINLGTQSRWWSSDSNRMTIGQKISAAKKGKSNPCSSEKAKAISEAKKASFTRKQETLGYKMSPEHIAKMAATKTGKPQSSESNAKRSTTIQSLIASGVKLGTQGLLSDETKRKIGNAHRGMKRTKETCKNIAQSVSKAYIIKYTDGSQETVVGLKAYAFERGLPYGSITSALRDNIPMRKYGIASINRA